MSSFYRTSKFAVLALIAAMSRGVSTAGAQGTECVDSDKNAAVPACGFITSLANSSVTAPSSVGPVRVAARFVGGLSLFHAEVFFLGAATDSFSPTYNWLGTKRHGQSLDEQLLYGYTDWEDLGVFDPAATLVFGVKYFRSFEEPTYENNLPVFDEPVSESWLYSGYNATTGSSFLFNGRSPANDAQGAPCETGWCWAVGQRVGPPESWTSLLTAGGYFDPSGGVTSFIGFEGSTDGDYNDMVVALDFAVVPEPASSALLAAGLLGLGLGLGVAARRRCRRQQ